MVLLLLLLAQAQLPPGIFVQKPDQSFRVAWDTSTPSENFRWICNDKVLKSFVQADLTNKGPVPNVANAFTLSAEVPALSAGVYGCTVSSWNAVTEQAKLGDSVRAPLIGVVTGTVPGTPANVRLETPSLSLIVK